MKEQLYTRNQRWQKADELVCAVYRATRFSPNNEPSGLTSRLRESAASLSASVGEDCRPETVDDLLRYIQIADDAAVETQDLLLQAKDMAYITDEDHDRLHNDTAQIRRWLSELKSDLTRVFDQL